jgi:hypothetical protein
MVPQTNSKQYSLEPGELSGYQDPWAIAKKLPEDQPVLFPTPGTQIRIAELNPLDTPMTQREEGRKGKTGYDYEQGNSRINKFIPILHENLLLSYKPCPPTIASRRYPPDSSNTFRR